jgi:hypothetical protein
VYNYIQKSLSQRQGLLLPEAIEKTSYQLTNSSTMKYNDFTLGQIEAVFNKLGGEQGVTDFLSGKTKVIPLNQDTREIRKNPFFSSKNQFSELTFHWDFESIFLPLVDDFFGTTKKPLRYKTLDKDSSYSEISAVLSLIEKPTQIAQEIYEVISSNEETFHFWNNVWFFLYEEQVFRVSCDRNRDLKIWSLSAQKAIGLECTGSRIFY